MSRKIKFHKNIKIRWEFKWYEFNVIIAYSKIKEQKEWKNENGRMTQKLFMNRSEERTLLSLNLKFKGAINLSVEKIVKVMKRLLIPK